jgi:peptidyl-prolyl isomerase G (cyclophilin G)
MPRFRDAAELLKISFLSTCRSPKGVGATMPKAKNPHVFMDISIGEGSTERITFEVVKLQQHAWSCFAHNGWLF